MVPGGLVGLVGLLGLVGLVSLLLGSNNDLFGQPRPLTASHLAMFIVPQLL